MLEALWSVRFISNVEGFGSGVAVLETDVLGGDAQCFYVGSYNVESGIANATVTVTPYAGPSMTVFGQAKKLTLKLTGKPGHSEFDLQGFVAENPAFDFIRSITTVWKSWRGRVSRALCSGVRRPTLDLSRASR